MSKNQAMNELKERINQTRQRNNNGGFPQASRPNVAIKERRTLRGHFGKGKLKLLLHLIKVS